jgi:hypothetical protein
VGQRAEGAREARAHRSWQNWENDTTKDGARRVSEPGINEGRDKCVVRDSLIQTIVTVPTRVYPHDCFEDTDGQYA